MVSVRKFQLCLWAMCISFEGLTVPFPPRNVTIEVATHHVIVKWDPPIEPNDAITIYVVSYSILPDLRVTINYVTDGSRFSLIPVEGREGRLFKIQVQAQNKVGLGNPSAARYARIGCGKTLWLNPSASTPLIYPETEGNYNSGILCQWTLFTKETCFFRITFVTLQLMVPDNKPCIEDYVTIGNKEHFCHAQEEERIVVCRDSKATVIFNSDIWAPGKRFNLLIMSIKLPGPPSLSYTLSSDNAIILKLSPPTELTLPLSGYVIRYSILPDGPTFSKIMKPNMFHFSINTKHVEGKVILMNVTARIYDIEGVTSNLLKVRAQCQRNIVLEPNGATDIYSPNYPNHYPLGIICTWRIRAKRDVPLSVKFLDFQLEDSYRCTGDYITISTNPDEKFCGAILPFRIIETDVASLDVTFISNNEDQKSGFHLQVLARGTSVQVLALPQYKLPSHKYRCSIVLALPS
ncbi:hypothetical protein ACJMK2_026804 [Sinanodonta woodiana]|uniref:Uncharacterized protein n=1 Tax=Sinanodonta woodiana TaxID=1069815 RepID=A0ABD3XKR5_SINWO